MRKAIITSLLLACFMTALAIPAKPNLWKTLRLKDGTTVEARLIGDEFSHYYIDKDGNRYAKNGDYYVRLTPRQMRQPTTRSTAVKAKRMARLARNRAAQTNRGTKRGLILLVNFKDIKLKATHTIDTFEKLVNKSGYKEGDIIGSVHDYFLAQSNGLFDLSFDVKGAYQLEHNRAYYGENFQKDGEDTDRRPGAMVAEACRLADNDVDFKNYDWNNDGEVDQVYIIYPGRGEADKGSEETIWPHEWNLESSDYGQSLQLDKTTLNTYACGPELDGSDKLCGIGTICHEFSHCLGLPDFYDTSSQGATDMGVWSLMSYGNFGGNGHIPTGYTAYEKWLCGWQEPTVLHKDTTITNIQPISSNGETFVLYNEGNSNEFYLLENRQTQGWDADLPDRGLMITHVDYDQTLWADNQVNTEDSHPRYALITANGKKPPYSFKSKLAEAHNLYPDDTNQELTDTSTPSATLYNANIDGSFLMHKEIKEITQQEDLSMSFRITIKEPKTAAKTDTLFYESFKDCQGTGGNDGKFSGRIATAKIYTDNAGWTYNNGGAGKSCMKVGNSTTPGSLTSPTISFNGDYILTVRLATWVKDGNTVDVRLGDRVIDVAQNISSEHFTTYSMPFSAKGSYQLIFTGAKRFFIDDVLIMKKAETTAISNIKVENSHATSPHIYNLRGQNMGTSLHNLPPGIYIVNGKKVRK